MLTKMMKIKNAWKWKDVVVFRQKTYPPRNQEDLSGWNSSRLFLWRFSVICLPNEPRFLPISITLHLEMSLLCFFNSFYVISIHLASFIFVFTIFHSTFKI